MKSMIFYSLLAVHVLCGSICMACAIGAIASQKGAPQHKRFGRYFFYAMTGIFVTALPMAYIKTNLFLFLVALFSYYLAYSGWRYARRHEPTIPKADWFICIAMIAISILMIGLGLWRYHHYESTVLMVFGLLGGSFSLNDARTYYKGTIPNKIRIVKHLSAMLGATIAIYTAFVVTNIHINPPILLWLGPTVILTPVIMYWKRRVNAKLAG